MEAQVKELLPLAAKIAREFDNIPGLPHAEIEMAAQEALARAARLFDPAKGDFPALGTLGLLKSGYAAKGGCGVSPQAVLGASRHQSSSPQVDDFPPQP